MSRVALVVLLALGGAGAQSSCQTPVQLSTATSILAVLKKLSTDVATLKAKTEGDILKDTEGEPIHHFG